MELFSDNKKDFLLAELDSFFRGDKDSRLLRLYRSCSAHRTGRGGRLRKGPFALYWLFRELGSRQSIEEFIDMLFKLNRLQEKLYRARCEIDLTLKRYRKRRILEAVMKWPELVAMLEKRKRFEALHKTYDFRNLQYSALAAEWRRLDRINTNDLTRLKQELREIRKWDALAGRLFKFLVEEKTCGINVVDQRRLQRRFTKRISELKPILVGMAFDRVIVWNRKKKTISLNGYEPNDRRKFIWLAGSSWPRSPFEPYLKTGKIYKARNFRGHVIDEWIKTGAAKLV